MFLLFILLICVVKTTGITVLESLQNSSEWWMVQNSSRFNAYTHMENSLLFLRHADLDSQNIHSCYEYKLYDKGSKSIVQSKSFCYPSIIITGYKKCSTSALYELMIQYPDVIFHAKESCILYSSLVHLFDSFSEEVSSGYVFDGCIYWDPNYIVHEVLRHPNTFYIMIYRDYANYLWSAYNFWCSIPYDKNCHSDGQWLDSAKNFHRSRETFHELVEAAVKNKTVLTPHYMVNSCEVGKQLFSNYTLSIWKSGVRPENTLILSSEEMEKQSNMTWHRIASSFGFTKPHPTLDKFGTVKYNVNANKGDKETKADAFVDGVYAISGNVPMLETTRGLLNKCWQKDCQFVSEVTAYPYSVCYGKKSIEKPVYSETEKNYLNTYLDIRLNQTNNQLNTFVTTKHRQCAEIWHKHNHNGNAMQAKSSELRILLLSTSVIRKTVARFLSLFVTADTHIKTIDISNLNKQDSEVLSHLCSGAPGVVIVTAHPNDIHVDSNKKGTFYSDDSVCSKPIEFDRVIVLLEDINDYLLQAVKQYRLKNNLDNLKETRKQWSKNLESQLSVLGHPRSVDSDLWSGEVANTVNQMSSLNRLILHMSDVRRDRRNNYKEILSQCIDFIFKGHSLVAISKVVNELPLPSLLAPHESVDILYCTHINMVAEVTSESEFEEIRDVYKESTATESENKALAYSDNSIACRAEKVFKDKPLELATLKSTPNGVSYCELDGAVEVLNEKEKDKSSKDTHKRPAPPKPEQIKKLIDSLHSAHLHDGKHDTVKGAPHNSREVLHSPTYFARLNYNFLNGQTMLKAVYPHVCHGTDPCKTTASHAVYGNVTHYLATRPTLYIDELFPILISTTLFDWQFYVSREPYKDLFLPEYFWISNLETPRTIYVQTGLIPIFVEKYFPKIKSPFVLYTGCNDYTVPENVDLRYDSVLISKTLAEPWKLLLESSNVLHWFVENKVVNHPKLSTMPIGMNPKELHPDDISEIEATSRQPLSQRPFKMLETDRIREGPQWEDRAHVRLKCERNQNLCTTGELMSDHATFVREVAAYPFVLCVHGGGLDPSPKAWESILIGTIPIVDHSTLDDAYAQLPIAFVDNITDFMDWSNKSQIMKGWLERLGPYYESGSVKRSETLYKLTTKYWWSQVVSHLNHTIDSYDSLTQKLYSTNRV